ncbi:hypothetical protein BSZ39_05890 [Bowdeniella nasicola]|uniref:ATP-binding cassette, subfamily B n=1 Tax=Bowdeniella nasicola TaxID=208480 RepID=A0A1Q5Q2L7_9ACTO|nr:ABC transporter ATP-binding protein [Bowdeniella nasicola]OKL54093.1 hypothetical protein BSZ39_05890 [Bowdeniella nasicola]
MRAVLRTTISLLPPDARRQGITYLAATVASIIARALGAVSLLPLFVALLSDEPAAAWPWVGVLAALTIAGWALDYWAAKLALAIGFSLMSEGQKSLAERIGRLDLSWLTSTTTASARAALSTAGPDLARIVGYLATPVLGAILTPIAIGIALLFVSVPLGLVALAGVPLLIGAYLAGERMSRKAGSVAEAASTDVAESIIEFARAQQALRAARRSDAERSRLGEALRTERRSVLGLLTWHVSGELVFTLASQLALIALASTTVALAIRGELPLPAAVAMLAVIGRYLESFTVLGELTVGITMTLATMRRFVDVFAAPTLHTGTRERPRSGAPRLELVDVTYTYPGAAAPVISGLNLTLEAGQATAIIGPSGSGKSTILALLAGLIEPTSGRIEVDGVPLSELAPAERDALVAVIFQHPYLFSGSLADNIRSGADLSEERLAELADAARLGPVIAALPDGWASDVGEGGSLLSGGERQRVSIARALAKNAPVLLVDEATSALDIENERAIVASLAAGTQPCTRVVVAHNLATIQAADRVIFLADGTIREDGEPADLIEADGYVAEFWRQQQAARSWQVTSTADRTGGAAARR